MFELTVFVRSRQKVGDHMFRASDVLTEEGALRPKDPVNKSTSDSVVSCLSVFGEVAAVQPSD